MENLTLVIPAKKEKESLPSVINELKKYNLKILVVLEKSDKETIESISECDCQIVFQKNKGYGDAILEGLNFVNTELFCIFNADGSFNPIELKTMYKELQDKKLPIRINDWDTIRGARVVYVHPFGFMNIVMMQTPGYHEIKEFIGALNAMYTFEKMFSIQLVKQPHYDPEDHFDILRNHWKLDRLEENIERAQSMCLGPDEIKRT